MNNKVKFLKGLADLMEECGVDEVFGEVIRGESYVEYYEVHFRDGVVVTVPEVCVQDLHAKIVKIESN